MNLKNNHKKNVIRKIIVYASVWCVSARDRVHVTIAKKKNRRRDDKNDTHALQTHAARSKHFSHIAPDHHNLIYRKQCKILIGITIRLLVLAAEGSRNGRSNSRNVHTQTQTHMRAHVQQTATKK